jgi:hypothetical protein
MTRAPLRFLATILALWIGARLFILLPGLPGEVRPIATAAAEPWRPLPALSPAQAAPPAEAVRVVAAPRPRATIAPSPATPPAAPRPVVALAAVPLAAAPIVQVRPAAGMPDRMASPAPPAWSPPATGARWSASAWLLVREERRGAALAPAGTLGGSQAGARIAYSLGGGLAFSGRAYLPLRRTAGAELAAGLDWRPLAAFPVNLLAERRQRLGREGRSAFALTLYGGAGRDLAPRLRLDGYGQAGMVGLNRRDLFVDGAVRLTRRLGPVELGAGAWVAAQPGAARLDAGPSLAWHLPVPAANLRLQADWRFRVAGDAMPRSGPALTLASDF